MIQRTNRVFNIAVAVSLLVHVGAIGVVAFKSAAGRSAEFRPQDLIAVEFEKTPPPVPVFQPTATTKPPPNPVVKTDPPEREQTYPTDSKPRQQPLAASARRHAAVKGALRAGAAPGLHGKARSGGGSLNYGSSSSQGNVDLGPNGGTSMGWVSGDGKGSGSGSGDGEGNKTPVGAATPSAPRAPDPPHAPVKEPDPPKPAQKQPDPPSPQHHSTQAAVVKEKLISRVNPSIPDSVTQISLDVSVTVKYVVDTDGSVTEASVSSSSGIGALDRAAVDAVKKWRYSPAIQGGSPRRVHKSVTFAFRR